MTDTIKPRTGDRDEVVATPSRSRPSDLASERRRRVEFMRQALWDAGSVRGIACGNELHEHAEEWASYALTALRKLGVDIDV